MNKILAMREKRGEVWDKAKAFLNEHQDENGMLSPEDAAQYKAYGNSVAVPCVFFVLAGIAWAEEMEVGSLADGRT